MGNKILILLRKYAKWIPFMYATSTDVVGAIMKNIDQLDQISKAHMEKAEQMSTQISAINAARDKMHDEVAKASAIKANIEALINK